MGQISERHSAPTAEDYVREARKAVLVMVGLELVIWVIQIVNWADGYRLDRRFGIEPRNTGHLTGVLTAAFFHFSWTHIEANSGPLFVFGLLAAYRGVRRFLLVTLLVALTSGLAVWLFQSPSITVGASGLIYGYFGYVVVKGIFDRHLLDTLIGAVMALSFAYLLMGAVPGTPRVSWLGHLGGLAGGLVAGWALRERRGAEAGPRVPDPTASVLGSSTAISG